MGGKLLQWKHQGEHRLGGSDISWGMVGEKEPLDRKGDRKLSVGGALARRTSGFLPKLDNAKRNTEISLVEKFRGA